jgi:hypothetical protein
MSDPERQANDQEYRDGPLALDEAWHYLAVTDGVAGRTPNLRTSCLAPQRNVSRSDCASSICDLTSFELAV